MTYSDMMLSMPVRPMPDAEMHAYKRFLLDREGFDMSLPIEVHPSVVDVVFSQPLAIPVEA